MHQLWQQRGNVAALAIAWQWLWQQCASAAALSAALWCSGLAKRMQVQQFWQQLSCCHAQLNGNSIMGQRCSNSCCHIVSGDSDLDSKPVTGEKGQQSTGDNSSRGGATAQASDEVALATVLLGSG